MSNVPPTQFSPREDAQQLHRAFKGNGLLSLLPNLTSNPGMLGAGIGCDAGAIVDILGHRDASQRDDIQQAYDTMFSTELKKTLSSELHGHLKKAVVLWMQTPLERDASTLRQALAGPISDSKAATEIICSRSSSLIRQIKNLYGPTCGTRLEYDIEAHTSSDHKRLLLAFLNTTRYEGPEIDQKSVEDDAKVIGKFGEKKSGVDEGNLIQIFSERSKAHIVALDSTFHKLYGRELKRVIKKETSGSLKFGLMTILECAHDSSKYFARVLHKAMKGLGTRDTTLIRIIVTRAELDMKQIRGHYRKMYGRSLADAVHSETSGHYRAFLLALLGSD